MRGNSSEDGGGGEGRPQPHNAFNFETPANPSGYFVVNLDKDEAPLPYSKFNTKIVSEKHRLIETTALGKVIQQHLAALNRMTYES